MIIYKVTNLINGKVYVGKTKHNLMVRKNNHLAYTRYNYYKSCFHDAIHKYGEDNFKWEIIDSVMFAESLNELEKYYIKKFNSRVPNGYNMTDGGDGILGVPRSQETKDKISKSKKGKYMGVLASNYGKRGRHPSDEARKKMSLSHSGQKHNNWGKHLSEETRKKISAANGGKKGL